jgi:hypothetical protein
MTHFHKISVKLLSALSIPITKQSHADIWKKKANAHSEKDAHSSMTMRKRDNSLTLFQIFQKE